MTLSPETVAYIVQIAAIALVGFLLKRLRDVCPNHAVFHEVNCGPADAKLGSKIIKRLRGASSRHTNGGDRLWGQPRVALGLAAQHVARPASTPVVVARRTAAFVFLVGHVVGLASKKKMVRANACRVVTAMANDEPARNIAMGELPRKAMSHDVDPGGTYFSASRCRTKCIRPKPAARRLVYLRPKALFGSSAIPSRPSRHSYRLSTGNPSLKTGSALGVYP